MSRLLPEFVDNVGILPLNDAYAKAKARKEGKDSDEARKQQDDASGGVDA